LSPVWSIGGFDSCVHISEEASNASTAVPFAIIGAISCAGVLGWLCVIVIVACMGTDIDYHLASPYGQPMASIYALRLGKNGTLAIWSIMFVIQFGMGMSITLSCSRQIWAFSRDNALPMSRYLKRVTKKAVPIYAVWGAVFCSLVLGLLALINTATAQAIFAIAVLGTYAAYVYPEIINLKFRERQFLLDWFGEATDSNQVHSIWDDFQNLFPLALFAT
jgi:amino acid transporter